MAHDVFISHARQDKSIADAVCATLEQKGIRCWIAPRDVEPGAEWGNAIMQGIKGSRVMVLVLSGAANTSPHILREVERAVHFGIVIVPVRIEEVLPEGALEYHLGTVHWLDAMSPPHDADLDRLADTVQAILRREAPITAGHAPPDARGGREAVGMGSGGDAGSPGTGGGALSPGAGGGASSPGSGGGAGSPDGDPRHAYFAAGPGPRPAGPDQFTPPVKRTPVVLVLLFNFITAGIYSAAWFLTRRSAFDAMRSESRIHSWGLIVAIVLMSLNLLFTFTAIGLQDAGDVEEAAVFEALSWLVFLAAWIIVIIYAFMVRSILDDHFNKHQGMGVPFSGAGTFFFLNAYLQYKINRLIPPPEAALHGATRAAGATAGHGHGR